MSLLAIVLAFLSPPAQVPPPPYQPEKCLFDEARGRVVVTLPGAPKVEAGQQVKLEPRYTTNPGDYSRVPLRCLTKWKVSDPKLAKLSRDGKSIHIAANAPEGAQFTVSATYRGKRIEDRYTLFVPVKLPLVGFWSQEQVAACAADTRMMDLVFARTGEFAVAFGFKFHGSKDYRGKWRIEGDRVILSDITGTLPKDLQTEARFTIDAQGGLTFDKPWFGTEGARGTCTAPFVKVR